MAKAKYEKLKPYAQRDHEPLLLEGHRPVTRRQFLAQGFIGGGAFLMGTSLLGGLLGRSSDAYAAAVACGAAPAGGSGMIPFVCVDLAGGASIAGSNVLVGGPGGQTDELGDDGYIKLGLPPSMFPRNGSNIATIGGGLVFHSDSALLRGMQATASPTTLANTDGCIICARSANDTGNNPHNPMYGIYRAGADGQLVTLIGTRSSDSGGRSRAPDLMIDLTVRPTRVARPSDAMGLADAGRLGDFLDAAGRDDFMAVLERMTHRKVDLVNEGQMIHDLTNCGVEYAADNMTQTNPNDLDPTQDPDIVGQANSIFTSQDLGNSKFRKTASVMKLVVNGFAGAGTIEFGGYDYHNSTRATGEVRDFDAGKAIGAVLEYAARRGTPVMVYLFSDGSVSSPSSGQYDNSADGRGKGIWKNDNSGTAATVMFVYNPNGPNFVQTRQLGYYRPNGSVETGATPIANSVDLLAQAVVLNYLALHGREGMIDQVLPGHGLGSGNALNQFLAFGQIA